MQALSGGGGRADRGSKHNILRALFYVLRVRSRERDPRILVKAFIYFFFVESHMAKMWQRNERAFRACIKEVAAGAQCSQYLEQQPHYFLSVIADRT